MNQILLWNMESKSVDVIDGHSDIITDIRFRPNSTVFATSSFDKTLQIWDASKVVIFTCLLNMVKNYNFKMSWVLMWTLHSSSFPFLIAFLMIELSHRIGIIFSLIFNFLHLLNITTCDIIPFLVNCNLYIHCFAIDFTIFISKENFSLCISITWYLAFKNKIWYLQLYMVAQFLGT